MGLKLSKSAVTKGVIIFALLSVSVMIALFFWTTEKETWSNLAQFRLEVIPVLLIIATARWFIDGMAFVTMAKHGSKSTISVKQAAGIRVQGILAASIVPVVVGIVTMHAYMLHKEKLKLSEAVAISALQAILPVFIFLFNIPILLMFKSDPMGGKFFIQVLELLSIPIAAILFFLVITLFYPQKINRLASGILHLLGKMKFINLEKIVKLEKRLFHEIDQVSKIFWKYLKKRKAMLIKATGWLLCAFIADYFLAIAIIWGFGIHPPIIRALAIQFLMRPIIYLAFTPGGAGIWEFTYAGFFFEYLPKSVVGVSVLMWRVLLNYIPLIFGAVLLVRRFGKKQTIQTMLVNNKKLIEEELDHMGEIDPFESED